MLFIPSEIPTEAPDSGVARSSGNNGGKGRLIAGGWIEGLIGVSAPGSRQCSGAPNEPRGSKYPNAEILRHTLIYLHWLLGPYTMISGYLEPLGSNEARDG